MVAFAISTKSDSMAQNGSRWIGLVLFVLIRTYAIHLYSAAANKPHVVVGEYNYLHVTEENSSDLLAYMMSEIHVPSCFNSSCHKYYLDFLLPLSSAATDFV